MQLLYNPGSPYDRQKRTEFILTIPPHFRPRSVGYNFPSTSPLPSPESLLETIGSLSPGEPITFRVFKVLCYRTYITGRCTSAFAVRYLGNDGNEREGVLKISMVDRDNSGEEERAAGKINAASREETNNLTRMILMFVDESHQSDERRDGRSNIKRRPVISLFEESFHLCSEVHSSSELAKVLMDGIKGESFHHHPFYGISADMSMSLSRSSAALQTRILTP